MGYKSKFKGSTVEERLRAVPKKQDTLVSGVNIKTIVGESILGEGDLDITKVLYQPVTYQFLLDLRRGSKLKPGQFYRITDYVTTTSQANTKSAGNQFDVIVLALTSNKLSERAWAIQHKGNTYFQNSNLEAWQLWYSLDNDTNRFSWADEINGKGVIYRMVDEFGNDCPYDFKNIQFYRKWDPSRELWSTISPDNTGTPCYTFSSPGSSISSSFTDMSLKASLYGVHFNIIKAYIDYNFKQVLNNICFFGSEYSFNTFGNDCYNNTFGTACSYNTFGTNCYNNIFGNNCSNNTFGKSAIYFVFGNNCSNNTFGNLCINNTFGRYCSRNSFGNCCQEIKFASNSSVSTIYNYYQDNHFGDGCQYIVFRQNTGTVANDPVYVQNYNFAQGISGTSSAYLPVDGERNRAYETKVAKNSSGTLKIYCEADLAV